MQNIGRDRRADVLRGAGVDRIRRAAKAFIDGTRQLIEARDRRELMEEIIWNFSGDLIPLSVLRQFVEFAAEVAMAVMLEDWPIARRRSIKSDAVAHPFGDLVDFLIILASGDKSAASHFELLAGTPGLRHAFFDPLHHHVLNIGSGAERMQTHAVAGFP